MVEEIGGLATDELCSKVMDSRFKDTRYCIYTGTSDYGEGEE